MTQEQLIALIQARGLDYVNRGFRDAGLKAALDDGLDLTNWEHRQVAGAVLLYQVEHQNGQSIITDGPRILCVHGPESDRAQWETIAADSDAPTTVLMLQSI